MYGLRPLLATVVIASLSIGAGCASSRGPKVAQMSAAEHDLAARDDKAASRQAADRYDPRATRFVTLYPEQPPGCDRSIVADCSPFWTTTKNTTDKELSLAAALATSARKHRLAAKALRDAESHACVGVTPADRDISPFFHREDIRRVEEIGHPVGSVPRGSVAGGVAVFVALPGLTVASLQRIVDCHLARNAELGFSQAEDAFCPLNVRGAVAHVRAVSDGLAVEVTSIDVLAAREIARRILTPAPATAAGTR
jgi:hypothetical protein